MTSQSRKQTVSVHMSPSISRSKDKQVMKSGQLIKYNIRNIFLKNHTQNVEERLFPDPSLRKQN